jgi:hypothetical protein
MKTLLITLTIILGWSSTLINHFSFDSNPLANDPVPAGCEIAPIQLDRTIEEPRDSGFDKIDQFNLEAKSFRLQALNITDKALKLVVTSCQVTDPEIGEYTHRECYTGLDLKRTEDCRGDLAREGKGVAIANLVTTLREAAQIMATGESLVTMSKDVGTATLDEVKGNRMKLVGATRAVNNMNQTVGDLTKSLTALRAAIKYAEGSKAALESWDLQ